MLYVVAHSQSHVEGFLLFYDAAVQYGIRQQFVSHAGRTRSVLLVYHHTVICMP